MDFSLICSLIIPGDEAEHCCVVCKFYYAGGWGGRAAVVCEKCEESWAKNTTLGASVLMVKVEDVCLPTLTYYVRFVRKSSIQLHNVVLSPSPCSLLQSLYGRIVLNAELKSTKRSLAYVSLCSRCSSGVCTTKALVLPICKLVLI